MSESHRKRANEPQRAADAESNAGGPIEIGGHRVSRLLHDLTLARPEAEELSHGPVTIVVDPGLVLTAGDGEDGTYPSSVLRIWIDVAVDDDGLNFREELGTHILASLKNLGPQEATLITEPVTAPEGEPKTSTPAT